MAHAQILASFLALWLLLRGNPRRASALAIACGLGFVIEWIGSTSGFPFGAYAYSALLMPKLFGVPCVMAMSWANISISSYLLAGSGGRLRRILIGAALMVTWDLTIDPTMGRLYPFWTWAAPGSYYGIPATNFAGWLGCAVVFMLLFDLVGLTGATWRPDARLVRLYYAANIAASVALALAARLWLAVALTGASLAVALQLRVESSALES
jgi:putative membrane protein